jgi:flagellar motor switch/type III secretory pathway protein FliN
MSSSLNSSSSSNTAAHGVDAMTWVMDVPCPVDFILGTATVKVRDCAAFTVNAIVRLKQTAGADLEVRVAGIPIATGEVVIADENVALRVGRILPPVGQEIL